MAVIGLTGGIATGKSTVCKMLSDMGAKVFDADKEAHLLLSGDTEAAREIKKKFHEELGFDMLDASGNIDRKKLGAIVFSDPQLLKYLESVMHHHIEKKLHIFVEEEKAKNSNIIVLDIPLLFEKNWQDKADEVWLVHVPQDMQMKRLKKRDNIDDAEARKRLAVQMPIDDKKALADTVIDNSDTMEKTHEIVKRALEHILK